MTTTRTPREQPLQIEITEHAVGIFLKMEELRRACSCGPKCAACVARRKAHNELNKELGLRPWDWVLSLWEPGKPLWKALQAAAREMGYHNDKAEGAGQLSSQRRVRHDINPHSTEDGDGSVA